MFVRISRYLRRIKIAKRSAISFALVENHKPVKAGLGTLQDENLKCVRSSRVERPTHGRDNESPRDLPGTTQAHRVRPSFVLADVKMFAFQCC